MSEQWRTAQFRANIVRKINDHITTLNLTVKNDAAQMENNIFQKASTEHEYLSFIAKLIVYLRGKDSIIVMWVISNYICFFFVCVFVKL